MPTNNSNTLSREGYLKTFGHPRKAELATMLLDGASVEELNAAGFGRINILEMASDIRLKVEGQKDFSIDIPRGTGMDSSSTEDIARTAVADDAEKKESPSASQEAAASPEPAQGQPAGDSETNDAGGSVDQRAPSGDVVPGVTANEPTAHPTETLGGHPVGTLTGEEDAAALQRKADDQAQLDKGDAA